MITTALVVRMNVNTILASSYERIRRNIELLWKVDDSVELVSFALEDGTSTAIVTNSPLEKYPILSQKATRSRLWNTINITKRELKGFI